MLGEQQKQRIREEEEAAARALLAREHEAQRARAMQAYRAEVRSGLRPRRFLAWWLLGALLAAVALMLIVRPHFTDWRLDDTAGGIANSALMARCQDWVSSQLPGQDHHFPDLSEAAGQMTAGPDGKRWDGWVGYTTNFGNLERLRLDFSCEYTPATDLIHVEIIQP